MRRIVRLLAHSLAVGLTLAATVCSAAPQDNISPRPGLYQVDTNSESNHGQGVFRRRTVVDGASGNTTITTYGPDGRVDRQVVKGSGPTTQCIKKLSAADMVDMSSWGKLICPQQTFERSGHAAIHTANCQAGTVRLTMRKLDNDVWEYVKDINQGGNHTLPGHDTLAASSSRLDFLRPVLEHEAKHGATAEKRHDAARQLADLPRLSEEIAAKQVETLNVFSVAERKSKTPAEAAAARQATIHLRSVPPLHVNIRTVMTRISDTCTK